MPGLAGMLHKLTSGASWTNNLHFPSIVPYSNVTRTACWLSVDEHSQSRRGSTSATSDLTVNLGFRSTAVDCFPDTDAQYNMSTLDFRSISDSDIVAAKDAALQTTSDKSLDGKVAVVSGSSSGIGKAIAVELASRGAHVVINYPLPHFKTEADAVINSITTKSIAVCADIGTVEGPRTLVETAVETFGKIDIVVNNAAIAVNKPFEEQTLEEWDRLVNINGRGTFLLTQYALPHLSKPGGRIVNICSASSRGPPAGQTIYAGTKGMVDSFTRCWAKELPRKYGCTVNAVSPGPTRTEGFAAAGEEAMKILQPTIDAIPVAARMGESSEIAFAVAFLCEDRARWINGVHLHANGGLLID